MLKMAHQCILFMVQMHTTKTLQQDEKGKVEGASSAPIMETYWRRVEDVISMFMYVAYVRVCVCGCG